ncbi:GntR family transcriptional regulator [Domibacillus antri]|uniref:GntR family transcriptional regulator n=1 Tax=Domibacillus antri TaxID=1714264 RepID=A0A1Q8Q6V0_9BACI|nr:FadR/GntR family transcriptional regulator [Domibacillus antri]OLN23059.1 GntR family transcriptional regulator [Domibacillus antri]
MEVIKAKRSSLVEQVALQIETFIESGTWPVGSRIPPEMELMEQFGVSRNTLREAVRALVHAGLLQTKQGIGTYVRAKTVLGASFQKRLETSTLLETLEVRHALEREAAWLAAERHTGEELNHIQKCLHECKEAADLHSFAEADIALHHAIVKASHNRILMDLYARLADELHASVHDLTDMNGDPDIDPGAHEELVKAIGARQPEKAAAIVSKDIARLKEMAGQEEKE